MTVEIVVPWRAGCPHRQRAWNWLRARYAQHHPDWLLTEASGPTPWCKARAVMPAVTGSSADIIAVADADVWTDGLADAIHEVQAGAAWAIPHHIVHRLSEQGTAAVIAGLAWPGGELSERSYPGMQGGGIVVAAREVIEAIPMDPRFVGWGQEDESWAIALHCLLGPAWRGDAPMIHLWHPPQERISRRRGSQASWALRRRYGHHGLEPAAIRSILEEARAALDAAEPALHDHAA